MRTPTALPRAAYVAFVILLAGCMGDSPKSATHVTSDGATVVSRQFNGTVVARVPVGPCSPLTQTRGHSNNFVFVVPNGTQTLRGHLTWDQPQAMDLEFAAPGEIGASRDHQVEGQAGPLDLAISQPQAGDWTVYVGPPIEGVEVTWTLTLTWESAQQITVESTVAAQESPCAR